MKTNRHFVFPSVCLFCLRLANCIMKMSINFPTICRQRVCHVVLPPTSRAHTQPQSSTPKHTHMYIYICTHTVACHTQCQLQIEFICWRQILTWQTHFYFILFAFLFHSLLMVCIPLPLHSCCWLQLHLLLLLFFQFSYSFIFGASCLGPAPKHLLTMFLLLYLHLRCLRLTCLCLSVWGSVCAGGLKWHINFQRGNEIIEMKLSPEAWAPAKVSARPETT